MFDVVAHKTANKSDVKLRCINLIRDYFNIDKMQFSQAIYTSDLEYELMNVDGVRSVNFVELTQNFNDLKNSTSLFSATDNILLFDTEYDITDGSVIMYFADA